jgi:hypothetical protein
MSVNARADIADAFPVIDNRATGLGSVRAKTALASLFNYLRNIPAHYSNHLATAQPQYLHYPHRISILLCLLLACAVPRAMIAAQIHCICPDGVLYVRLAEALNESRFQQAFEVMELNIYPAILMVLNRLGLSWETAGMLWGLTISCLVVLPLYGWLRRQFDDTVALAACALYVVQPIFIQWSPELIRDPTFWFFFTLTLYLLWRTITEVSVGFSIAAGVSLTLAVLTRFEGLFLLIPLVLWTFWRCLALDSNRLKAKITVCGIISVFAFPAIILLINFTLLRNHSQWVSSRLAPLTLIQYWWNGMLNAAPADAAAGVPSQSGVLFTRMVAIYIPVLVKGLSPIFALLMLCGLWRWRRVWARRDNQPLFYTALATMIAAWIHAWCAHESCDRYFLPIVLMASPFAALGLLAISGRLLGLIERLNNKHVFQSMAVFAPLSVAAVVGWSVIFSEHYERRDAEVELAGRIHKQFENTPLIFGSEGVTPVVAYYAKANWTTLTKKMDNKAVLDNITLLQPDVILISATRRKKLADTRQLIDQIQTLDYKEIERSNLPHGMDDVLVVLNRVQAGAADRLPDYVGTGVALPSQTVNQGQQYNCCPNTGCLSTGAEPINGAKHGQQAARDTRHE